MIRVLLFGAISIINGVACDEEPITLSQHHDTSVSLEPHESHIPYRHLNVRDGDLWNSNHGRLNILNQKNILPWEYQTHYSESFGNRHDGYINYINRNSNNNGHLLPFRDDILTYNYRTPHLQHKLSTDYPKELILRKFNHNSHIGKSENNANTHYDGYKRSSVHNDQRLSLIKGPIYSTPYINPNLDSNNLNNFNNYNSYGHSTYLGHIPKLPGNVQSPQNHHHPYVNHGTDTRYLHHGYSHDGKPRQAYRHFKDVAIAVKELIHQKKNYKPYIHAYNRYHAQPRLRHYGRSSHTETVGILMPHKERPYPYILPEYRRYNFNNEYDIIKY